MEKVGMKTAFTLVELIIAIAITAIIATVSFISFQNFFATSKDTIRIEDMKSLKVALSSIKAQNWGYSYPDSYFTIMNSGTTNEEVYQWFINSNMILNDIPQIPKDPQTSNYYVLSTTKTKQQYQIAMTLENNWTNKAFVDGDYYSNTISIFPSIILAYSWTSSQEIASWVVTNGSSWSINRTKFILNWSKLNLPYSLTTKNIVQTATSYNQIIQEPWINLDRNTDYYACKDMYDDKKYLWPGYYDLIDSTSWLYVSTYCDWVTTSGVSTDNLPWVSIDTNCTKPDITIWSQTWAWCNSTIWSIAQNYNTWVCYNYNSADAWNFNCYWNTTQEKWTWISSSAYGYSWAISWISDNIYWALYTWDNMNTNNCFGTWISNSNTSCPCKWGYHIPTTTEWDNLEINLWCSWWNKLTLNSTWWECTTSTTDTVNGLGWKSTNINSLKNKLWLSLAGLCVWTACDGRWYDAQYWTSSIYSPNPTNSWLFYFGYGPISSVNRNFNTTNYAFSVRCLKNDTQSYFPWEDWSWWTVDDCTTPNIVLSNWQEWSACNLWATIARSWANNNTPAFTADGMPTRWWNDSVNGKVYQWWRNKWFWWTDSTAQATLIDSATPNVWDTYNYVIVSTTPLDWLSTQIHTLWWWSTSDSWTYDWQTNDTLRQWPCPTWWHVPSTKDWQDACNAVKGSTCIGADGSTWAINTFDVLKLPRLWYRYSWTWNWVYYYQLGGLSAFYWSSSPAYVAWSRRVADMNLNWWNSVRVNGWQYRAMWEPIRCLKND